MQSRHDGGQPNRQLTVKLQADSITDSDLKIGAEEVPKLPIETPIHDAKLLAGDTNAFASTSKIEPEITRTAGCAANSRLHASTNVDSISIRLSRAIVMRCGKNMRPNVRVVPR